MPETLTDAQKVLRNDTGKRIAVALEALASDVEPSTVIAPEYDETQTYAVGELVIYRSVLYRCTTSITTPEEWTAAHWAAVTVADELAELTSNTSVDDDALTWESGTISSSGQPVANSARIRTTQFSLLGAESIAITVSSGYRYECDWYDESNYEGATGWKTDPDDVTVPQNASSVRILLSKSDNTQITTDESSNVTVRFTAKTLAESCIVEFERLSSLASIGNHELYIHSGTTASELGRAGMLVYGKLFLLHGFLTVNTALSKDTIIYDLPNYNYGMANMNNNLVLAADNSSYTTVGIDNANKTLKVTYNGGMQTGRFEIFLMGWIN